MTLFGFLPPWLASATPVLLGVIASIAILLLLRAVLLHQLRKLAKRTTTNVDDYLLHAVSWPSLLWCVAIAVWAGIRAGSLPAQVDLWASRLLVVLLITSVTLVMATISAGALQLALVRRSAQGAVTGIANAVVRGTILLIGAIVLLNFLGVQIAPLLTALGVGGLAVALALQDTLGNLFAGIHILLEKPFAVGQWIAVDGLEGKVLDIGWRTTRVLTTSEQMVVLPNSKIASSTIQNFHLPNAYMGVVAFFTVAYRSDLEQVISVVGAALDEMTRQDNDFDAMTPAEIWVRELGESGVSLGALVRMHSAHGDRLGRDVVLRCILRCLKANGIETPFPQRVVHLEGPRPKPGADA
jgi:small-conductance mechanosensitive channel